MLINFSIAIVCMFAVVSLTPMDNALNYAGRSIRFNLEYIQFFLESKYVKNIPDGNLRTQMELFESDDSDRSEIIIQVTRAECNRRDVFHQVMDYLTREKTIMDIVSIKDHRDVIECMDYLGVISEQTDPAGASILVGAVKHRQRMQAVKNRRNLSRRPLINRLVEAMATGLKLDPEEEEPRGIVFYFAVHNGGVVVTTRYDTGDWTHDSRPIVADDGLIRIETSDMPIPVMIDTIRDQIKWLQNVLQANCRFTHHTGCPFSAWVRATGLNDPQEVSIACE